MPLTAADAEKYKSGLTKKQSKRWVSIVNSVIASGANEYKAITIANSNFNVPFNPAVTPAFEEILKKMAAKVEQENQLKENHGDIPEMEIFRTGTHNGEPFDDKDLQEIVDNFHALKSEVRPKLKITHREKQESLAGLASYGDIVDVFIKAVEDGSRRLFAKISNVPNQVIDFIKNRRFPERSIEIYPKLKLGTKADDKIYRNVLKAIALLGSEMPAVTGMAPIKLSEIVEVQSTVCFGDVCFVCTEEKDVEQQENKNDLLAAQMTAFSAEMAAAKVS